MKPKTIPIFDGLLLLVIVGFAASGFALPPASAVPGVSGSYKIIQKTEKDGLVQVQLRLNLANRGAHDLHIQRITLWDLSHPSKGGTQVCSVIVHSAASASTTQEFTIPRAEFDLWKRGTKPRVVLNLATPDNRPSTVSVRLDPALDRKGR
jgi:hypothetical protein